MAEFAVAVFHFSQYMIVSNVFFLTHVGTAVVGIWRSVGAEDVGADARVPLECALGSVSPYGHYFPFQSTEWHQLFPGIQTGYRSVLACKVRVCFSSTQGFGVGAGKQGWFTPGAAPPCRRWRESGEDIWARLLLHAC